MQLHLASFVTLIAAAVASAATINARDTWSDQVLGEHNTARMKYGARPLTSNSAIYPATLRYAEACHYGHSDSQGDYGENLYVSTSPNTEVKDAVAAWMEEASDYNYDEPGFSAATGHFTQVVWKSTTQVSCAIASCAPGTIFSRASRYVVCRYTPPGNFEGEFSQNVGRRV